MTLIDDFVNPAIVRTLALASIGSLDEQVRTLDHQPSLVLSSIIQFSITRDRAGISDEVQGRIQDVVPSAELFETLWEWEDTPAGSLLITDQQTALVSVRIDDQAADEVEETAIWGSGARNSLVVVLRAIFTWRLGYDELP